MLKGVQRPWSTLCWALEKHNCMSGSVCAVPLLHGGLFLLQTPIKMSSRCVQGNKSQHFFFSCPEHQGVFWRRVSRGEAGCDCGCVLCWERGLPCAARAGHHRSPPAPAAMAAHSHRARHPGRDRQVAAERWLALPGCPSPWPQGRCEQEPSSERLCVPSASLRAAGEPDCKTVPLPESGQRRKKK